jgi:hypothetical protein
MEKLMSVSSLYHSVKPGEEYKVEASSLGNNLSLALTPSEPMMSPELFSLARRFSFSKRPVRVEDNKIVANIHQMEVDVPYPIALLDRLFILRKRKDGIIETYELCETHE